MAADALGVSVQPQKRRDISRAMTIRDDIQLPRKLFQTGCHKGTRFSQNDHARCEEVLPDQCREQAMVTVSN
jgi:hypothetical protein